MNLPPELDEFALIVGAVPEPLQIIYSYCLAMLLVQAGKARLESEVGELCTFVTAAGNVFSLTRPPMDRDVERALVEELRGLVGDV